MATITQTQAALQTRDRAFLTLPLLAGAFFGVAPFFFTALFARATGYTGHDPYIYELAGAATLGYAVALFVAVRQPRFEGARIVAIATLAFNLASLYACATQF